MPYYKPYREDLSSPGSDISVKVEYPIDGGNVETGVFPVVLNPTTPTYGSTDGDKYGNPILRGKPSGTFRQVEKLPVDFSVDPCNQFNFYTSGYSDERDRIVYLGEDLREDLNNNYTGCCFDENGNFVQEPSLNQKRTIDIKLEAIGFDTYGKPTWASQNAKFYHIQCEPPLTDPSQPTEEVVGTIVRSETFTLTFNGMSPQIRPDPPYLDDDIIVKLVNSNGTTVECDKDSTSPISMTATYPETITIKVFGSFGKKLFPNEAWEYYFRKYNPETNEPNDYTPVPEHLSISLPTEFTRQVDDGTGNLIEYTKVYPTDPNDYYDAYRVDQDNKVGIGTNGVVRDLSEEVPEGVYMLGYVQDPAEDVDVVLSFSVTSSIPPIVSTPWSLYSGPLIPSTYVAGDYVTNGGNLYRVDVGGTVAVGPAPNLDAGPSGTGFTTDVSGIVYRYIPSNIADITSYGAGDWTTTMYVLNDQSIGFQQFQDLVAAQPDGREKTL
jgi:hypothetical protein